MGGFQLIYGAVYKKFNYEVVIIPPKIVLSLFTFNKETLEFPLQKGIAILTLINPNIITIEQD
jgi:hypothetical protein